MNATNLPPKSGQEPTVNFFNNFFKSDLTVTQNVDDAVIGYFQTITGERESARVLASAVLFTALNQGLDPMSVIDELRRLSQANLKNQPTQITYTERVSTAQDEYAKPGPAARPGISELDAYLTMFLNLNRSGTSLLGISNSPQTNKYIQRAILP